MLISDVLPDRPDTPGWLIILSIGVFSLGVALMMIADCQKYFTQPLTFPAMSRAL